MKRIILTESQFNSVIKYRSNGLLKEQQILEEGYKEWALTGLLTLASIAGLKAQTVPMDSSYIKAAELVHDRLKSNDEELLELFTDAQIKLNKENLKRLKSVKRKDFDEAKLNVYKTKSIASTHAKQRQGFTISDIKITKDTILPDSSIIFIEDSLFFEADNLFKTGEYTLTNEAKNKISNMINLLEVDGKIVDVEIIASTDTEPISIGNEKLSELRAESVRKLFSGVDSIDIVTSPNQGPNIYTKTMSDQDRRGAREKTAQYRYVEINIIQEIVLDEEEKISTILTNHEVELIKLKPQFKTKKISTRKFFKKPKCKKIKIKGTELPCHIY